MGKAGGAICPTAFTNQFQPLGEPIRRIRCNVPEHIQHPRSDGEGEWRLRLVRSEIKLLVFLVSLEGGGGVDDGRAMLLLCGHLFFLTLRKQKRVFLL